MLLGSPTNLRRIHSKVTARPDGPHKPDWNCAYWNGAYWNRRAHQLIRLVPISDTQQQTS